MYENDTVVGRYAPSPTGALHMGNLRTALLAWLHTRMQGGRFLLRMEDIDSPRVVKGSADQILRDLEWLGLDWDGEVVFQSDRQDLYQESLKSLEQQNLVYPCFCSRRDIRNAASAPQSDNGGEPAELIYPGTCRNLSALQVVQRKRQKAPALRLKVGADLAEQSGDFVIKRADSLFAYQLVVVADDLDQGVTQVIRGADLAASTARQKYLAHLLDSNREPIAYFHAPLLLDDQRRRMSKRDGSMSVSAWREDTGSNAEVLIASLLATLGLTQESSVSLSQALGALSLFDIEKCLQ